MLSPEIMVAGVVLIEALCMIEWLDKGPTFHFVLFIGFELEWFLVCLANEKERASPTTPIIVQQARQKGKGMIGLLYLLTCRPQDTLHRGRA